MGYSNLWYNNRMSGFSAEEPIVEVDMFEWQTLREKGTLYSGGFGPCIVVALYNPAERIGMLGHFPCLALTHPDVFEQFLGEAANTSADPTQLRAWVGGGELCPEDELDQITLESRQIALNGVMKALGVHASSTTIAWLDKPGTMAYYLNVGTGAELVEVDFDEDI